MFLGEYNYSIGGTFSSGKINKWQATGCFITLNTWKKSKNTKLKFINDNQW